MLICVDGTGTAEGTIGDLVFGTSNRPANYAVQMMGSFVGMVYYGSHLPNRAYYQGPDLLGTGPNFVWPLQLYQQIRQFWQGGDHQIFMAGYSRGGGILIQTAAILTDYANPMPDGQYATVEAMFLFDAVARSRELDRAGAIPSNVKYCYHAMRDPTTRSRWSFGNCGTSMAGTNTYLVTKRPNGFFTTHGGMGGILWGERGLRPLQEDIDLINGAYPPGPIRENALARLRATRGEGCIDEGMPDGLTRVSVAQEKAGSEAVHSWMWPFLRKHRVL